MTGREEHTGRDDHQPLPPSWSDLLRQARKKLRRRNRRRPYDWRRDGA